jgi:gamma-glutamylcyclotransferase (GGCT)/AIG2-like uncharacterized protein YtfP
MTTKVFAYGSIYEGMIHFNKISAFVESHKPALMRGTAYRLRVGFPVVLNQGEDLVPGQILEIKSSVILMAMLDEYFGYNPTQPEKSLYIRQETAALTEGGEQSETCWAYYLNPKKLPESAVIIEGGNWLQSMKENPLLTEKLTDRQRTYIQKLGAATGRDIVPIHDMSLYRELIGLELIVDKGRRLALSKLGREVYRYLG